MPNKPISEHINLIDLLSERLVIAPYFLSARSKELQAFIACMPFPAWIKDYETRMIYINPCLENQYGTTVEEYNNKFDFEVWANNKDNGAIEAAHNLDLHIMETRNPARVTQTFIDNNGIEHTTDVIKWPLLHEGRIIGVAGIVENFEIED